MVCRASEIGARSAALVCLLFSAAAFAAPVPSKFSPPTPKGAPPAEVSPKEKVVEPSSSDLLIGFSLLYAPPGTPEAAMLQGIPDDQVKGLFFGIHTAAIRLEIMDEREQRYILARKEDFQADLDLLRRRRVELADAPLLQEAERLPRRDEANERVKFNRAHHKYLEDLHAWDTPNQPLIQVVMSENNALYQVWDAIRDARCPFYYITVRRQALKKLKGLIGDDAFYEMDLPPNVPIWRFREMK